MRRRPKRPGRCHLAARSPARPCCWRPPFPAARCCARSWPRPRSRTEPPTPARGGAPQALQACRSPAHARRSLLKHLKPATASSLGPANCALCLAARPLARPRPPRTMVVNPLHAAAASAKSPLNHYMQPCNYSKIFPNRLRRSPKNAANYAVGRLGPPNLPQSSSILVPPPTLHAPTAPLHISQGQQQTKAPGNKSPSDGFCLSSPAT